MQIICTLLQIPTPTSRDSICFTGQRLFLMPNQQCQSTEGTGEWSCNPETWFWPSSSHWIGCASGCKSEQAGLSVLWLVWIWEGSDIVTNGKRLSQHYTSWWWSTNTLHLNSAALFVSYALFKCIYFIVRYWWTVAVEVWWKERKLSTSLPTDSSLYLCRPGEIKCRIYIF